MKHRYNFAIIGILSLIIILLIIIMSYIYLSTKVTNIPTIIESSTVAMPTKQTITHQKLINPTQTTNEASLPNSLYFITEVNGINQIFRMERDGSSYSQITHEGENVEKFDVSRKDGSIVFVRNNILLINNPKSIADIVITNKLTTTDKIIFCAAECNIRITTEKPSKIIRPIWSEDGNYIAYNNDGLFLYSLLEGKSKLLLPDGEKGLIYYPTEFSPDGKYLLVKTNESTMNGGIYYIYNIITTELIQIKHSDQDGYSICPWILYWTSDSKHLLNSKHYTSGACVAGLWIYDLFGNGQTLITSVYNNKEQRENRVYAPWQLSDGSYYYFFFTINTKDPIPTDLNLRSGTIPYKLYHSSQDGVSNRTLLRPENIVISDTTISLWALDGSGIIISDNIHNQLLYIPIENTSPEKVIYSYEENINSYLENINGLEWGP